jgi:hypothetical protein
MSARSSARRWDRGALAVAVLAAAAAVAGKSSLAGAADTRAAFREPARAVAATLGARIDAGGRNESPARFPRSASVSFQTRLAPPVVGEPVASGAGAFVVAHGRDRVSALDASGHALWSVRLGAELASGPIPLGADAYLLVTRDARLFELSSAGVAREREELGWNTVDGAVLFAPTAEGGAVLATGARLARVGPEGARGFRTKLGVSVRAVFDWRGATLSVGRDGSIWLRGVAGDPLELGDFSLPSAQVALAGDRLFSLAEHGLESFDLSTRRRALEWADAALSLHDLALAHGERVFVAAGRATLVELAGRGHELARFTLPAGESGAELSNVVVDRTGALLVVANGSPLWSVTPEGEATSVFGTGCPDALRPTPVADGRVVAACRSGLVRGLSDKAR